MANNISRKELLAKVYKMVPPMLEKFHKGQLGRVAVMGGSEDYTGAPYFSAMASAKLGADMSHVICEPTAANVIKTYSPNLMVHPYMRQEKNLGADESPEGIADKIIAMLDRLHVLVIGPGLGRDALMQETCARVLVAARERNLAVVLDADGLYLVQTRPELIHGYKECILTPNVVEFQRLAKSQNLNLEHPPPPSAGEDSPSGGKGGGGGGPEEGEEACARLARSFGGVTIIQKGREDIISDGATTLVSSGPGGLKRSGGQGDTLTGCVATFLAWRRAYLEGLWPHGGGLDAAELLALAAFGGSAITRECSRLAFAEKGRSLQAGDLTGFVHEAFLDLLGEKVGGE